ncbi:coproporphyrinogen III oxidase, partial [Mobiluncus curtisii]|nr:coproporphyrinogen III oxidase [Mobiluncus curtisii]
GALLPEDATSGDRELAQKDGSLSVGLCSQVDGLSHQDGLLHQDGSATDSLTSNTGRAVLTRRGRLLADTVIQRLAGVS